ncbi:MAG: hypothetical protein V4719_05480 [Planctomycetota bacterium]
MSFFQTSWNLEKYLVCCGLLAALGCGGPATGSVSGSVAFNGKPVQAGVVTFVTEDGTSTSGNLTEGEYQIPVIPLGSAKVTVQSLAPAPAMVRADQVATATPVAKATPFVPLPERYQNPKKSGLEYVVISGTNTFDIDLTP